MEWLLLILLLFPAVIQASCTDGSDPDYALAVLQGRYQTAFERVTNDVHATPEERPHFKIIAGFSRTHDDRYGQADPDTLDLYIDPALFREGKNSACQGIAHELTHLRQFRSDRYVLETHYSKRSLSTRGWNGCSHEDPTLSNVHKVIEEAYGCLQENELIPHAAAMDIEAVLAQVPYAGKQELRDFDLQYLVANLKNWSQAQAMIKDHSNESFYLPGIKRGDILHFCEGVKMAREQTHDPSLVLGAWQAFCRSRR